MSTTTKPTALPALSDEQIDALHDSMFPRPLLEVDRAKVRAFARAALAASASQQAVQAPAEGDVLTDAQIEDLAEVEFKAGRLNWAGFQKDAQDVYMRPVVSKAVCDLVRAALAAQPNVQPKGMAAEVERVMDHRAHWRTAIVMMRDFGHLLAGKDGDADHTDWELVRKEFESALDALAAAPATQAPAPAPGPDERAAFEAWAARGGYYTKRAAANPARYHAWLTNALWDGWTGRAESTQAPAVVDWALPKLLAHHAALLEQSEYTYFELAYTRQTGWMAWITDKPGFETVCVNPDRKVIAKGQGGTPEEAAADALAGMSESDVPVQGSES